MFPSSWLADHPFFWGVQLSHQPLGTARVSSRNKTEQNHLYANAIKLHRACPVRRVVGAMCATPHVQTWRSRGKPFTIHVDDVPMHVFMVILIIANCWGTRLGKFKLYSFFWYCRILRETWDSFSELGTVIQLMEWKTCRSQDLKHWRWCNQDYHQIILEVWGSGRWLFQPTSGFQGPNVNCG